MINNNETPEKRFAQSALTGHKLTVSLVIFFLVLVIIAGAIVFKFVS